MWFAKYLFSLNHSSFSVSSMSRQLYLTKKINEKKLHKCSHKGSRESGSVGQHVASRIKRLLVQMPLGFSNQKTLPYNEVPGDLGVKNASNLSD